MSASHSANSIPDTQLGLTQGELQYLRHQQQLMAQRSHPGAGATRGRGDSRHSVPSSRAASAASSQGIPNRVVLDSRHLAALQTHLDNVMRAIEHRMGELEDQTQSSVSSNSSRHSSTVGSAESQIERMKSLLRKIDDLEAELDRVKRIKDAVRRLRARVDGTSDRLDRSGHHTSSRHR